MRCKKTKTTPVWGAMVGLWLEEFETGDVDVPASGSQKATFSKTAQHLRDGQACFVEFGGQLLHLYGHPFWTCRVPAAGKEKLGETFVEFG